MDHVHPVRGKGSVRDVRRRDSESFKGRETTHGERRRVEGSKSGGDGVQGRGGTTGVSLPERGRRLRI